MVKDTELPPLPRREPSAHKGDFGKVLVVAGSRNMPGAASLATEAALRSGAGLAVLAVPASALGLVAARFVCSTFVSLPETSAGTLATTAAQPVLEAAKDATVVAMGPGLSQHPETVEAVRTLVRQLRCPLVLDADALNAFAGRAGDLAGRAEPLVLTPHPGEMARLTGLPTGEVQADREQAAVSFARERRCILVLKGHGTVVTDGERAYVNTTGNPGMATGGSGDVLTGMIAGLVAQGIAAYEAAKTAVFMHGLAGDLACIETGEISLVATDILAKLPQAFKSYAKGKS